ncbi:hypothetical protein [Prevotella melaninogenica]|uniref:hypothetical protein n=1 Tax=Prevotella melaninogenica TaxID=28132 RepID=UPI001BAD09DC|nr:hypothetical protein [Prevotella melaninogenica]QUB64925.1 hypothetical protein J5A57_04990 [Prevotella melaninogenica]
MKEEKNNDFMDNPNLSIFNKVRKVPNNALKQINAGRLKGMSDVNPVWRILAMTDTFGICGVGWKYEITKQWTETYGNEIKGFCNINMFIKVDGEWSDAIPGTGGASFVAMERNGAYVSDEVYKMALTDALSVAMKSIGVAADIYFSKGADLGTKYAINEQAANGSLPTQSTDPNLEVILANIKAARNTDELKQIWDDCYTYQSNAIFKGAMSARKKELK